MTTKLTLSIDDKLVKSAKKYAQTNNTSISKIVSNYLRTLEAGVKLTPYNKLSPRLKKLAGAFKVPEDFENDYYNQMEKKHSAKTK
ncbi:MAG: DUF6364 family protein [Ferruginibacter sp.]